MQKSKWFGVVAAALFFVSANASAKDVIKMGTLAPAQSKWGQELAAWAEEVKRESGGEVEMQWQWNQSDEVALVDAIRNGQIHGAAVTALGLSQINKDILMFQLPGLFPNWAKLDVVRNQMKAHFEKAFEAQGFLLAGYGDVGAVKMMSVCYKPNTTERCDFDPVRRPSDLKGNNGWVARPFSLIGDVIGPEFLVRLGGGASKQVTVTEIGTGLGDGSINSISTPAYAAEQLQWAGKITHINTMTTGFGIGALLLSAKVKNRELLSRTGVKHGEELTKTIRNLDAQAFARFKASKRAYDPTPEDREQWATLFSQVRQGLRGKVFTPAVFDEIVAKAK